MCKLVWIGSLEPDSSVLRARLRLGGAVRESGVDPENLCTWDSDLALLKIVLIGSSHGVIQHRCQLRRNATEVLKVDKYSFGASKLCIVCTSLKNLVDKSCHLLESIPEALPPFI